MFGFKITLINVKNDYEYQIIKTILNDSNQLSK